MNRWLGRFVLAVAGIAATAAFAATGAASAPDPIVAHGHATFLAIGCFECHGTVGQGGAAGPRIAAPVPLPYAALAAYVRHPRNQMPPYTEKVLSETDLRAIYAYLQTIPKPAGIDDTRPTTSASPSNSGKSADR